MPHYKDTNSYVHFVEKDFEHLLPYGCVEITDEKARELSILNTPADIENHLQELKSILTKYPELLK